MTFLCMTSTEEGQNLPLLTDSLLTEIGQGNKEAFAELYRRTSAAVYGFALSILKNRQDAEDIMQETYLRVRGGAAEYRSQGKPLAWILTITKRLSLMRLRKKTEEPLEDHQAWNPSPPSVSDDDKMVLEAAMKALNDTERQIVMLHAVAGMKHREIAALLDLTLPSVLSKYSRALKKLERRIKEESAL